MTIAWGIMITQDTNQIRMMLLRARFAVLLNFRGWQIAYHRSWAMQLRVSTDTDTEIVWHKQKIRKEKLMNTKDITVLMMIQKVTRVFKLHYHTINQVCSDNLSKMCFKIRAPLIKEKRRA